MNPGDIYQWNDDDIYVMFFTPTLGMLVLKRDGYYAINTLQLWCNVEIYDGWHVVTTREKP
jgi:hypothetical protein